MRELATINLTHIVGAIDPNTLCVDTFVVIHCLSKQPTALTALS